MRVVEFGSLFQFIRNGMSVKQDKSGDGLPITRIETIADATIDGNRVGYAGVNEAEGHRWLLEAGDILFSHINSVEHVGKCAIYRGVPEKLVHGMNLLCMRCDQTQLLPAFAAYLIRSPGFRARLQNFVNKAVNQASVSIGNLKPIPVSIPSLPEQRRIAAILDQADALKAKRREALAQLDSLTQSILLDLLKTEKSIQSQPLKNVVQEMHQGINTVTESIEYQNDGFPIIQSKHITQGYLDISDARFVSKSTFTKYKENYQPDTGDVLLCNIGTIGKSLLISETPPAFLIAWNLFLIKFRRNMVEPCYCKCYLDYLFLSHYFDQFMTGGTVKFISKKTFSATPIQLPSVESQRQFAAQISSLEAIKDMHKQSLVELDTLFASLQHRAFRGEL